MAKYFRGLVVGLAVVGLMLAGVAPVHARASVKVLHVFLAAGQSNMSGRGLPIGGPADAQDPRIFQYGAKDRTFRPATVPLDMHDTASGLSPATAMARNYLKTQPDDVGVLIIPAAHGQTGFTFALDTLTWTVGAASAPELDLPTLAVKQTLEGIAAAKAAGYVVELKGVLWHQGENNSASSTAGYSAKLDQLIAFFRTSLAAPELPFVVGQMSPEGIAAMPGRINVDTSHQQTPARVPFTGFAASMTGGVYANDTTHFSRIGAEYLGQTYLSAFWRAAHITVIPVSAAEVAISGTPKVGSTLTAVTGAWGPEGVALTYQWYRSDVAISGATDATYTPGAADLGGTMTVKVTGSKTAYTSVSRTSDGTGAVGNGTLTPAVPVIEGIAQVGSKLTAVPGVWGPGNVALTYQWYRSQVAIPGATGATYTPAGIDAGRTITVKVTGSQAGYTTAAKFSAGTSLIANGTLTPGNPSIQGTAKVGSTLTAAPGTWGPGTVALTYQWYRSQIAIAGATGATYTPGAADLGRTMTVRVTGAQAGYTSASKTSAGTSLVASGTLTPSDPSIQGTTKVGSTLTAVPGAWGPGTVTLAYQWYRSQIPVTGATSATYALGAADAGRTITVKVTGSQAGYTSVSKISAGTSQISNGSLTTSVPSIQGTAKVGATLTAVPGIWGPGTVTLTYQWYRSQVAIVGATAATYKPGASDAGRTITVKVTGSQPGYTTASKTSPGTSLIAKGTLTTNVPSIQGTAKVGSTLTAVTGVWGPGTVTLTYQWYRSDTAIVGATGATYKPGAGDVGRSIKVKVTGTQSGYTSATKTSPATSQVSKGTLTTSVPSIQGTVKVGATLTAVTGVWGPGTVTLKYQWYRSHIAIVGATAATYKSRTSDAGRTITVKVTGSKAGYTTVSKTSAGIS